MPGAYPHTSTYALTNATLPWIMKLANLGVDRALEESEPMRKSLNLRDGKIMHEGVAKIYFGK